jgi:L-threonylcarbamoyladenylate synthase
MTVIGTDIAIAKRFLDEGELVAIPTETVYGLAANAFDQTAVAEIYSVKGRPSFNPLIIHSNSLDRFIAWGIPISHDATLLAAAFSPGPITFVVPSTERIPDLVTAGHSTVAIRIPNHPLTLQLLSELDYPLAAPSANPSEFVSPTNAQHVADQLYGKIPYILDGGQCAVGLESTIIDLCSEQPRLLRLGAIDIEMLEAVLQKKITDVQENDNILAPGMMKRHYATRHPMFMEPLANEFVVDKNMMAIRFSSYCDYLPEEQQILLSENASLSEAASNLFAVLRNLDKLTIPGIVAERFPDIGIGRAINDRLQRAASN